MKRVVSMGDLTFKAFAITNEIDLNKIAIHCGIPKKFTWEQPLILRGEILKSILHKVVDESQMVLVFSFGSIVFINHSHGDEKTCLMNFIHSFEPDIEFEHTER